MEGLSPSDNDISTLIESQPYKSDAMRGIFNKWASDNDGIQPEFLSREEYDKKSIDGIIQDREDGKKTLYIPEDMQLWEAVGILATVDRDSFPTEPKLRYAAKKHIREMAEVLQDTAIHLAKNYEQLGIDEPIAQKTAVDVYMYARSIGLGVMPEKKVSLELIKRQPEKNKHQTEVEGLIKSIQEINSKDKEIRDSSSVISEADGRLVAQMKEESVQDEIKDVLLSPQDELARSLMRRGLHKLIHTISAETKNKPANLQSAANELMRTQGIDLVAEELKLKEVLGFQQMKNFLEEARQSGDMRVISNAEQSIAKGIQTELSKYEYNRGGYNPSYIIENKKLNCVGYSTLGCRLMQEVGLTFYFASVKGSHASTLLQTADNQLFYIDMQSAHRGLEKIEDENVLIGSVDDLKDGKKNATRLLLKQYPPSMRSISERNGYKGDAELIAYQPEIGIELNVLEGQFSISTPEQMIIIGEKIKRLSQGTDPHGYIDKALGLLMLDHEKYPVANHLAVDELKKAVHISPTNKDGNILLADAFLRVNKYTEARQTVQTLTAIYPDEGDIDAIIARSYGYEEKYKDQDFYNKQAIIKFKAALNSPGLGLVDEIKIYEKIHMCAKIALQEDDVEESERKLRELAPLLYSS